MEPCFADIGEDLGKTLVSKSEKSVHNKVLDLFATSGKPSQTHTKPSADLLTGANSLLFSLVLSLLFHTRAIIQSGHLCCGRTLALEVHLEMRAGFQVLDVEYCRLMGNKHVTSFLKPWNSELHARKLEQIMCSLQPCYWQLRRRHV